MFGDGMTMIEQINLHVKDLIVNTVLMDARVHGWFDDYRFGIWPVEVDGRWYGKIFRFEDSCCDVDGEWLLAPILPAQHSRPPCGRQETPDEYTARQAENERRRKDRTKCDLTKEPEQRELFKVHFLTCLHWHVKGMGWAK
jgi:hypothetical protein